MTLDSFQFSYIGGRNENQDSVGKYESEGGSVYVVADGLGGHQFGNLASEKAVSVIADGWECGGESIEDELRERICSANEGILKLQSELHCVSKTTVVALAISDGKAAWAHTGDSRLYYIHQDRIEAITEDHSVAYKKYKAGEITRAQIATDEDQSCLLRALGGETRWEPNSRSLDSISSGDAFLLCTDGMWEYLLDEEILVDRLKAETAKEWAELLLLRAIARIKPGNDNLSLITVMVK